jgi:acyl-CoA ligase (AMP-forming) (exosortase A-associated)
MLTRLDDLVELGDGDRPAVSFGPETMSYAALRERVDRAARGLLRLGLRPGERVLVYLEKRIETVVAALAVSRAGGVLVPVNPVFKPAQVGYVAADCAAALLVTSVERHRTLCADPATAGRLAATLRQAVLIGDADPGAPAWQTCAWTRLDSTVDSQPEPGPDSSAEFPRVIDAEFPRVIDADTAAIFYTSGSTGGPKGVVLSHRNLLAGAESVAGYLGHSRDDVIASVLPLSFDAGFSQLTTSLVAGAHLVLVNYLLPREVVRVCARHGVTALTCVPPLWIQLAAQEWPVEAGRLRYFANTGGRMPRATLDRLRAIFPDAKPFLMYGLTEAFRSTYLDPAEVDRRPDSIGRAIPNADVLVVRPDGTECAPGEHGEIVHRGALVAQGYWNDPVRTAERFRPYPPAGGATRPEIAVWSGDTAYRDVDGFLYFVGRVDEMIKTSGYRVSPTEIEEVAYATGLVDEAVAFGAPDERLGQHVVLVVSGARCDDRTLTRALDLALPKYMLPQRIVALDGLPRSGNGKFDRVALRARVLADAVPAGVA